jgi:hypothetical protein
MRKQLPELFVQDASVVALHLALASVAAEA